MCLESIYLPLAILNVRILTWRGVTSSRGELKAHIDQLPETRLEAARRMLKHHINPPTHHPQVDRMQSHEYRQQVRQQFRDTRQPGTGGGKGGTAGFGTHEGTTFGPQSFHYWDDKALAFQSHQFFGGQYVEFMERLVFSPDRTAFRRCPEISGGGHTVRHEDPFPIAQNGDSSTCPLRMDCGPLITSKHLELEK